MVDSFITTLKLKRRMSDDFKEKHIRDQSAPSAAGRFKYLLHYMDTARQTALKRAVGGIMTHAEIFMTSYQEIFFCEQGHNFIHMTTYGARFEPTTSFPAIECSSNRRCTAYSAAKFQYGADYSDVHH